jgi:cellulose synthase/poly-beta-1,6-N-acetylglucosamine synthase-like glycosyltransferase
VQVTTDEREVAPETAVPNLRPVTAGRRGRKHTTFVSTGARLVRRSLPQLSLLLAVAAAQLASHGRHASLPSRVVSVGLGIFLAMAAGAALVRIRLLRGVRPPRTLETQGAQVDDRQTGPSLGPVTRLLQPEPYRATRLTLIRTVLALAVSTSLLWLTGHRPGPWEDFLVVALAIAYGAQKVPFIEQRLSATGWGARAGRADYPTWWTTARLRTSLWCAAVLFLLSRVPPYWGYLAYIGLTLVLGAVCWTTLVWMLDAWRHPYSFAETGFAATDLNPKYSFSLIVPARHEENVLDRTLLRLVETDYPTFEVLVVVGHDDHGTREVAERVAGLHPKHIRVITDESWPKNKPKALNAALPHCRGDITGVFDAEDQVHPALIRRVDQCFQKSDADAVQAGVQLMNFRSSWFAVRNVLEYYFWFRSRLHFHARAGFVPLGGNTVFIRTELLREAGGWDEECLAEDCELGVRISSFGKKVVVFYEPELVTREETPPTLGAFARQRTRWNQGFLQTLRRGYWRRLGPRQRALGLYTLAMPSLLALAGILIPIAMLTAIGVKAPVPLTLIAFLPLVPMVTVVGIEVVGLAEFCRAYGERASIRDYARLVLGTPLYQGVLGFAAARALAREALGARGWEKTAHFGLHLLPTNHNGKAAGAELPPPSLAVVGGGTLVARSGTVAPYAVAGPMHRAGVRPADTTGPSAFYPGNHRVPVDRVAMPGGVKSPGTNGRALASPSSRTVRTTGHAWQGGSTVARRRTPPPELVPPTDPADTLGRTLPPSAPQVGPVSATPADDAPARARRWSIRCAFWGRHLRSHIDLAIQIPLLTFVGLVQATNMLHWPGTVFDEGTYVSNAWAVQTNGVLSNYTFSYGHPPLGWIEVSLWTWANGLFRHTVYSIDVARGLMAVLTVISCALLYALARRLDLHRVFAVVAVILFALCPLGLWFHRLVLLDNVAVCWVLAAFVLALSPRRRLWTFAASGACFAASLLSKETILVLLPVLFLAAAYNADGRRRRYCLALFVSFFVLISLAYPLYAALKGELIPGRGHVSLIGYMFVQLFSRKTSGSIFNPQSGTSAFVHFWLQLDPWLLGVALLLTPIALARRSTRAIALAYLVQLAVILRPGYLPEMYVIALLPFAALTVAGSADALWRLAVERWSRRGNTDGGAWMTSAGFAPIVRGVAAAALIVLIAGCAIRVAPRWARVDHQAVTTRLDGPERAAQQWVLHHIDRQEHIIVSDDFWIYLIAHGYDAEPVKGGFYSKTVVFYWPLDYDPAVKKAFPSGWRDFDYVISTFGMRNDASQVPTAALAIRHSRVVASFGAADGVIEVRKIDRKPGYGPASPGNPLPVCPPQPIRREPTCG